MWLNGLLDLSKPNWPLAIITGLAQFWQAKQMSAITTPPNIEAAGSANISKIMSKQMLYMAPALTVFFGFTLPGGLMLYWLALTLLTVLQQFLSLRSHDKNVTTV